MVSVSVQGWGWQYASRTTPALNDITCEISSGERVLLLGASGSGKSTLLRALAGVLGADEGEATGNLLVDGHMPEQARGKVGLVLQDPENQIILERIGDDVAFGCENLGIPREDIWPRVTRALTQVGLSFPLSHSTAQLSGGQKQRLALAGNLAMQPGLVVLDEPTANLDTVGAKELVRAVTEVADETGATVIMVEHRVDLWWEFATRVIVLDDTGVLLDCPPTEIPSAMFAVLEHSGIWLPGRFLQEKLITSGSTGELLLRATALQAGYPDGQPGPEIDLEVHAGEIVAITGVNGVGKSALALTLGGLLPPHSGGVISSTVLSSGLKKHSPVAWKSRELLARIGSVFQAPEHQFVVASVRAELAVGPRVLGWSEADIAEWVEELLQRLHLDSVAEAHPFTLSGGQQRRLSVGTVMAAKPPVMILDEPTFGQDATTWKELVALCSQLRSEGHGLVVVTHDAAFVESVADRIVELVHS